MNYVVLFSGEKYHVCKLHDKYVVGETVYRTKELEIALDICTDLNEKDFEGYTLHSTKTNE